jgi:hypothetical protein
MLKRRRDKHCPRGAGINVMDADQVARVEKYCERFVASDQIDALRIYLDVVEDL